jgi:hypothetical protein
MSVQMGSIDADGGGMGCRFAWGRWAGGFGETTSGAITLVFPYQT